MKPIVFLNIAYMKYYDGIAEDDEPVNGGKYVNENNDAAESNNFSVITVDGEKYCFGYVQTKSGTINLKTIYGCNAVNDDEYVEGIIVVWCATPKNGQRRIVGWYKNATVNKYEENIEITRTEDNELFKQYYNCFSLKKDCVLLPENERNRSKWYVPSSKQNKYHFGFGQANVWYGKISKNTKKAYSKDKLELCQAKLDEYLETLIENIENYDGKNWLDDFE